MTDSTNQCKWHEQVKKSISSIEHEIDNKMWPVIRDMVQWKHLKVFGVIVIAFGLMLYQSNSSAIEKNTEEINCLKSIAADVRLIKRAIVP